MSNDDNAWVKETSSVLGEDANEEHTSPFQVMMPYVVLQIMQRLEPNHSVQVNTTGHAGVDIDPDVISGMSTMGETIAGPVFSSSLDVPAALCDTDVLTSMSSMSSVTNDVIFNDSGDSQSCRMYPASDFATVDVMKDCSEIEIVHGSDSAAAMLDSDGRLASAVGAGIEPLFSADRDILSGTADSELAEPNSGGTHSPLIRRDVTAYRCALCTGLSYSLDRAVQHAKRQHSVENANDGAMDIVPELLQTVYYCRICEAPSRTTYHWQSHMRRRHRVAVDRRRKPGADPRIRERKRLASLKDKSFVPIECVACGRQMRLTESYYLHIRRSHRDDGTYAAALAHLDEVRRARRERSSCRTIAVTPCLFCGVRISSIRHLVLVHPKEPTLETAIAATRSKLRQENIQQRKARAAVKVECTNCGRCMSRLHMRTHLQYHCASVIPELSMDSSVLLESGDNSTSNILSLDPPAVSDDCDAVALPEDELCEVQNAVECEMVSVDDVCSGPMYHHSVSRMVTCTERIGNSEEICGKRLNIKAYNSHRRKFHCKGNDKVRQSCTCPFCNRRFWDRYHLQRHLTVHTYEKVIVCLLCQHTFMHQFSYSEHFEKTHLRHFLHSCDSCGRGFWKRMDKVKHRCKPENRAANVWNNEQLQLKAEQLLDSWQGPLFVKMNKAEASDFPPPLKRQVVKKAWQSILCILCNKRFSSMRCYQLHHRHTHLLEFDHECSECGLCFLSRHSFQAHHCVPHQRTVNVKKRQVLAARMQEKMQKTSEPYYVFVDSDNQIMPYADNSKVSIKEISSGQSMPSIADSVMAAEANTNNSSPRLGNEDTGGSAFSQSYPFQLTENSEAELPCLSQCEPEQLLHSAAIESLSAELEMEVCDTRGLQDDAATAERSSMLASDADDNLLADNDDEVSEKNDIVPADVDKQEHSLTSQTDTESEKSGSAGAGDPGLKGQQWPMATSLGDGRLRCNVCHKELRVANYYPHMRRVHKMPSSQSRPIAWKVCDRCGYQCQDNYKMRRHALKHTRYAAGAVLCELCDRLFYEHVDYRHHFKRCHLGQFNIRCDACCRGFWKTNALRQHPCYPEMRDENVRLQREKEEEALRRRTEVRTSMGLGEGAGIDVVQMEKTDADREQLQDGVGESKPVDTSSLSAHDDTVVPNWLPSLHQTLNTSTSQNISETHVTPVLQNSETHAIAVLQNSQSNSTSDCDVHVLPTHSYGTRKKRISFHQLLQSS